MIPTFNGGAMTLQSVTFRGKEYFFSILFLCLTYYHCFENLSVWMVYLPDLNINLWADFFSAEKLKEGKNKQTKKTFILLASPES